MAANMPRKAIVAICPPLSSPMPMSFRNTQSKLPMKSPVPPWAKEYPTMNQITGTMSTQ
jgi:hypothetical protein